MWSCPYTLTGLAWSYSVTVCVCVRVCACVHVSVCMCVEEQLRWRRLQWFGHIWRMPTQRPLKTAIKVQAQRQRQTNGRCTSTVGWCDLISRDLRNTGNWAEAIVDRQEWRALINQYPSRAYPTLWPSQL